MTQLDFLNDTPPPSDDTPKHGLSAGSWVLIIGVMMAIAVFGIQLSRQNTIQPQKGEIAPDFTLTMFDGSTVRLSDLRGNIVLINFWGSWCAQCYDEAPHLQDIYDDYGDRGVIVLGINWLDTPSGAQNFIQRFDITYANGEDLQERVAKTYRVQGAPENFIVDANGVVQASLIGAVNYEMVAQILDDLLAKQGAG
jgi:cytochrome c biogenesis protein CcmG/thiol:disulfide interchange protein DsbE